MRMPLSKDHDGKRDAISFKGKNRDESIMAGAGVLCFVGGIH